MRFFLRPLRQGELDHELIWVFVSATSWLCFLAWSQLGLPLPSCPFHDLTGFPCVTCGATRCLSQLSQGHLLAALRWNPGVMAAMVGLALLNVYGIAVLAFRLPRVRVQLVSPKPLRALVLGLIALNWIYLLRFLP